MREMRCTRPLRVALVRTADGPRGSMARYGDLVAGALRDSAEPVQVSVVDLGMPAGIATVVPARARIWAHHAWVMLSARRRLSQVTADIVHFIDGSHAYVVARLPRRPTVATAHDVIPLLQSLGRLPGPRPSWIGRRVMHSALEGLRRVDRILADSHQTARDLREHAAIEPGRIVALPPAVPPWASRPPSSTTELPGGFHVAPFLLHVGNDAFYKNRPGVLRVFARVRSGKSVRLKMVGPPPSGELKRLARKLGVSGDVDFLVAVDDEQLFALYRQARLLLFPSLYEGFGWPPLEAMAAGCPVVCSDAASLPEVVGDAALTCAADDEETMAAHAQHILEDASLARSLVERGREQAARFSLERFAQGLFAAYASVLSPRTV